MKLAVVYVWFPWPPVNGVKLRAWHLLQGLARRHAIDLLTFAEPGEAGPAERRELARLCDRVTVVPGNPHKAGRLPLRGLFGRVPRSYATTFDPRMDALVEEALGRCEAAVAHTVGAALYLGPRPWRPRLFEEAEVAAIREQVDKARGWRQFRRRLTWWKYGRFIHRLVEQFDATTVVSAAEAQLVRTLGVDPERLFVVPNAADAADLERPAPPPMERVIYTGSLTFRPNFEAVRHFLTNVWPIIRQECPRMEFWVTGTHDGVDVGPLGSRDGVRLTGHVADLKTVLAESRAMVVPLLSGGGTRLKILEAMALGVPVVSTTKGVEGLDLQAGVHALVADRPEAFAAAVLRVLRDDSLRGALREQARQLVAERYTWDRSVGLFEEALAAACARFRRRKGQANAPAAGSES
jgi:glycosyltransferase involved in cell wall biosynthesis